MLYKFKKSIEYQTSPSGKKHRSCKVVGCKKGKQKKDGLCADHYNKIHNICTSNCKNKALNDGSGKCQKHRGHNKLPLKKESEYKTLPSGHKQRLCSVLNCNKNAGKGGMCAKHRNIKICEKTNCREFAMTNNNFCKKHKIITKKYYAPKKSITKRCKNCKEILPKADFIGWYVQIDENNEVDVCSGADNICKSCYENPEQILQKKRAKIKIKNKKHYIKYKTKIAECRKKYRTKNQARIDKYGKKWCKNNPFKILVNACKKIDKKNNQEIDITEEYLKQLFLEQHHKCHHCKHILDTQIGNKNLSQISVDRIDSSIGHIKGNCVLSCLFCNYAKNETKLKYYEDFMVVLKKGKITKTIKNKYADIKEHPNLIYNMYHQAYHCDKKKSKNAKSITVTEIRELIKEQNGRCAITGIPFINAHINKFPFKMSVDRIDNTKLHTKDNCQLVCMAIQYGKHLKTNEEVKEYIEVIQSCVD